jgi:hypothetical protein
MVRGKCRVRKGSSTRLGEAGARRWSAPTVALAAASAVLISACGGGARQDAHETARSYDMRIVRASFPARQSIAQPTTLELQVRNAGSQTVPDVAVTLDSLQYVEKFPELAADKRPVWAIEKGPGAVAKTPVETQEVSQPGSGQTAYVNTWALGPVRSGQTETFRWQVVPVKPGAHTVNFYVAAGLSGRAKAQLASGGAVRGKFAVNIAPAPPRTHVDPATGRVEPGSEPSLP